ncbi:MAG: hypothetical protein ACK5LC_15605 [Coprobacillaceae bacterium]
MKRKIVPIKNQIIENEIRYLERQSQEGYILKKRGQFLYQFERNNRFEATYQIEISDRDISDDLLIVDNWNIKATKNVSYKKKKKVYYMSTNSEDRLLVDNQIQIKYYRYLESRYATFALLTVFPMLLSFVLMMAKIEIPSFILLISFVLLLLSIYFFRNASVFGEIIKEYNIDTGVLSGDEANYIIVFKELSDVKLKEVSNLLKAFGALRKVNDETFRLQSALRKEELLMELIGALEIENENIQLMHVGDLYFSF